MIRKLLRGITLGGLAGFVLGILFAPQKGEETRKKLQDSIEKGKEKFKELKNEIEKDDCCKTETETEPNREEEEPQK